MQMTMHDLRVRDYSVPGTEGDIATKSRNALLYIEQLASMTKRDVSKWDMIALFGRPNSDGLVYDRNTINKIFFSQPVVEAEAQEVPEIIRTGIESGTIVIHERRRTEVEQRLRRARTSVDEHYRAIEEKLASIKQYTHELELLQEDGNIKTQVLNHLNNIFQNDFYTFKGLESNCYLRFQTKPITLTYKRPSHAVDLTVPMGPYFVMLDLRRFTIYVERAGRRVCHHNSRELWGAYEANVDNLSYDGYIHPHIGGSGSVCWGNINIKDMTTRCDLTGIMAAMQHVLTQYNNDSPYASLTSYADLYQDIQLYKQGKELADGQEEEEPDDQPWDERCEDCGEDYDEDGNCAC